jgi:hypothetical protein
VKEGHDVVLLLEKYDAIEDSQVVCELVELSAARTAAHDEQLQVRILRREKRKRVNQGNLVLDRVQPADSPNNEIGRLKSILRA